jgi:hypothetical protein
MVTIGERCCMIEVRGRMSRDAESMIVPGCLLVLLLPLCGAAVGQRLDGSEGGLFGLAVGFVLGCALAALLGWLLMRMKEE